MTNSNASAEQRKLAAIMFTDMVGYRSSLARLQDRGRVCDRRRVAGSGRDAGFSIPGSFNLGSAVGDRAGCNRISACNWVGV